MRYIVAKGEAGKPLIVTDWLESDVLSAMLTAERRARETGKVHEVYSGVISFNPDGTRSLIK